MKSSSVIWTDLAVRDLTLVKEYISKDSIKNANIVFEEIFNSVNDISLFPRRGRIVPKINEDFYREIFVGTYRIMYKIEDDRVFIVAVLHMAMDFKIENIIKNQDK